MVHLYLLPMWKVMKISHGRHVVTLDSTKNYLSEGCILFKRYIFVHHFGTPHWVELVSLSPHKFAVRSDCKELISAGSSGCENRSISSKVYRDAQTASRSQKPTFLRKKSRLKIEKLKEVFQNTASAYRNIWIPVKVACPDRGWAWFPSFLQDIR